MLKEKEREKEKNFVVGFICNWADIKFLLSSLLIICVLGTAFQFIPYKSFLSPNDLRSCLSKLSAPNPPQNLTTQELAKPSKPIEFQQENQTSDLITKRVFNSVGSAAYLFIQMGAYRGGLNTFAVVGLCFEPIQTSGSDEAVSDGYYHNQFLVVNDCLHRYRYDAKWMFFFDVDEFIYVDPRTRFDGFMDSMSGFTQFTIEQTTISSKLCLVGDAPRIGRMWGIEKLVYKDIKRGIRRDRKYAIQPRNAFSVGVHLSQNFAGKTTHKTEGKIKYFHYHGTIANRREPCVEYVNATNLVYEGTPYYLDDTLRRLAGSVKKFELKSIGKRLTRTTQ
ncbi:galactan beta-1,4-galactosyltransferase GALS3-like [Asparagus officinalis]|uniref:galactan beta-1,4-galactosyltransferase GALS3-like n=1 Tax=Asparagus officinalis TaxID=4686 RepID=UPI00098DFE8F|nr:galactan beta-1,4-galactosyltransferase GALS3-like [Asparagus officinalis]